MTRIADDFAEIKRRMDEPKAGPIVTDAAQGIGETIVVHDGGELARAWNFPGKGTDTAILDAMLQEFVHSCLMQGVHIPLNDFGSDGVIGRNGMRAALCVMHEMRNPARTTKG